jgi:hypothetical protein
MFYCWGGLGSLDGDLDGLPGLVSAGVAWRNPNGNDEFTIHVPDFDPLMVDSGGFQAATRFGNVYPYSAKELHEWSESVGADIVAGRDFACERHEELYDAEKDWGTKTHPGPWQKRHKASLWWQVRQMEHYESENYSHEFMPVIQGLGLPSYEFFIDMMIEQGLSQYDKLAIGTVCKRGSRDEILEILKLVRDYFPEKYIHLFGATLNIWKDRRFVGLFDSSDTAAWHWGSESKAHQKELLQEYQAKVENSAVGKAGGQMTLV